MSNSKLSKTEKALFKEEAEYLEKQGWVFYSFSDHGVTVGIRRTGATMGEYSISIASRNEEKFRKWVGIANVIRRIDDNQTLPITLFPLEYLGGRAEGIAALVSGY